MSSFFSFLGQNVMGLVFSIVGFLSGIGTLICGVAGTVQKYFPRRRIIYLVTTVVIAFACIIFVSEEYRKYSSAPANKDEEVVETKLEDNSGAEVTESGNIDISGTVIQITGDGNQVVIPDTGEKNKVIESEKMNTSGIYEKQEVGLPEGYKIFIGKTDVALWEKFEVNIVPEDTTVKEIRLVGVSPTGEVFDKEFSGGPYQIYTETGEWTLYAKLVNEAGVYVGEKSEEVVKIRVHEKEGTTSDIRYEVEMILDYLGL